MNICKGEEHKGKKKQCKPFENNIMNKKYTDTDTTRCSPCPAYEQAQWSQWTDWSIQGGKTCGTGQMKMTRKRTCVAAKDGNKKCQDPEKKREEMEFAMPRCEGEGGTGGQQSGGQEGESEEQEDDKQGDDEQGDDEQGDDGQTDGDETVEQTETEEVANNDDENIHENEEQNDDKEATDGQKEGAEGYEPGADYSDDTHEYEDSWSQEYN